MNATIKILAASAGLTIAALSIAETFAEVEVSQLDEDKILVSYSLADTNTKNGRDTLARKIRQAAENVCGPQDLRGAGSVSQMMDNRACFKSAVTKAMSDINRIS